MGGGGDKRAGAVRSDGRPVRHAKCVRSRDHIIGRQSVGGAQQNWSLSHHPKCHNLVVYK